MSTLLNRIVNAKLIEVAHRKEQHPQAKLERELAAAPKLRDFAASLFDTDKIAIIAEIKRRSPSAGSLMETVDPCRRAQLYESAGARAVSVLIDGTFFGGSYQDLHAVKQSCSLPVLAKEFIIDKYQLIEARSQGADAVLLIARILTPQMLSELLQHAGELGLACLVEIHGTQELAGLPPLPSWSMIGINNRDLATFKTNLDTTLSLLPFLPPEKRVVSESGIRTREDVRLLRENGVDACLVGEALMRTETPQQLLQELLS